MANATQHNDLNSAGNGQLAAPQPHAIAVLIGGMCAAWFAAGSTGLLGHPLQHALTWLALAVAIIAAWPRDNSGFTAWATLAGGVILAMPMTVSTIPTINVLAVVVVLAAIAQTSRGLTGRIAIITTFAAGALAIYRLACDCIPIVWLASDLKGWIFGRVVGVLAGSHLQVGATFGGLDLLVLMAALYGGWLVATAAPRRSRAILAAVAIVLSHIAYLTVLAHSEKLLAALPAMVVPPESEISNVGIWTWSNGLRMLIPWNLPLLAVAINAGIAAAMFRWASWLPVIEIDPIVLKKQKEKEAKEDVPGSVLAADMLFRFGPGWLAVIAVLLIALGLNNSRLVGKTVVAYDRGYLNWVKPEHESTVDGYYGMLPVFVESLGGKFVKSKDLSEHDLADADVLVLLHPDEPWSDETLERIWKYVRDGGSLLLVADPVIQEGKSRSTFNDVLQPTGMKVRSDTAVTRTGNWEQSYEVMAHPATTGFDDSRNRLGFELGSSIRTRWPARPVIVGRWGWSDPGSDAVLTGVSHYDSGELLGDLVLAAEQPLGEGRVFVLGGVSPLRNEMLANSYPFVGRLLGYLANRPSSPQSLWRQLLGLASLLAMAVLLAWRPMAWQLMLTSTVMAISLACCASASYWSGRVLPDGRSHDAGGMNNVAYVDASHLEAYSSDLGSTHGVASLLRALMRQGYLPLFAPDLTRERLDRAGLLISIAPAREFTGRERDVVNQFVADGGTFLCIVGAQESRASAPMLTDFDFVVPPSPVAPGEERFEPEPLGAKYGRFGEGDRQFRFYAAWPVECGAVSAQKWSVWSDAQGDKAIIVSHTDKVGTVAVIGDTHFADNDNLETSDDTAPDRIRFWRWLLTRLDAGQKRWDPPPVAKSASPAEGSQTKEQADEDDSEDNNEGTAE